MSNLSQPRFIYFRYYGLKHKKTLNAAHSGSDTASNILQPSASKPSELASTPIITVTTPSKGSSPNIITSPKKVIFQTYWP